jgi:colicin import membrane protein
MYNIGVLLSLLLHVALVLLLVLSPQWSGPRADLSLPSYKVNLVALQSPGEAPNPPPAAPLPPREPQQPAVESVPESVPPEAESVVESEAASTPPESEPIPAMPEPEKVVDPKPKKEISVKAEEKPEQESKPEEKPEPEKTKPAPEPEKKVAPKPKSESEPKPEPKPKPKPELTPAQKRARAERARKQQEQKALADELAALSRDVGDIYEVGSGDGSGSGNIGAGSGLAAVYLDIVAQTIKKNWSYPAYGAEESLQASVEVTIAPDGVISRYRLVGSSGRESYDDSVLRAVADTESVPAPPQEKLRIIIINFNPMER